MNCVCMYILHGKVCVCVCVCVCVVCVCVYVCVGGCVFVNDKMTFESSISLANHFQTYM